jgi:hypothetical protein
MTTTIVHCDRCAAKIDQGRARLVLEGGWAPRPWPTDSASGRPAIGLCGPCLDALAEWMGRTEAVQGGGR